MSPIEAISYERSIPYGNQNVDLIIAHHPLLFKPIKTVNTKSLIGKQLEMLIKEDITLYVMHTNYDISPNGLNKVLADMLSIKNQKPLSLMTETEGLGIYGFVDEIDTLTFISEVKKIFKLDFARFIGSLNSEISTVAITGGSGSSNIKDALEKNVDLYITGDISYHQALDAKQNGLNILDVGHNIERFGINNLKQVLENQR